MYGSVGNTDDLGAHQHEGRVAVGRVEAIEVLEHLFTAVVGLDASAVERERTVQAVSPPEGDPAATQVVRLLRRWFSLDVVASVVIAGQRVRGVLLVTRVGLLCRRVDADAHDFLVTRADTKETRGPGCVPRPTGSRPPRAEPNTSLHTLKRSAWSRLEVRKQDALFWRRGDAVDRGRVIQREEDHGVVIAMLALQIVDEAWRGRAKLSNPFLLVVAAMRLGRQP